MEASFGRTFSEVRLHSGPEVDKAADSLRASAFTLGSDIYLHSEGPDLGTTAGRTVLGEELAHVAQGIGTTSLERVTSPSEPLEQEAREAGLAAAAGQHVTVSPPAQASAAIARRIGNKATATETIPPEALALLESITRSLDSALEQLRKEPPDLVGAWATMYGPQDPAYTIGSFLRRQFPSEFSGVFETAAAYADKGWTVLDAIARPAELGGQSVLSLIEFQLLNAHAQLRGLSEELGGDVVAEGIAGGQGGSLPGSVPELPRRQPWEPPPFF
jgi:hypothetical protein